MNSRENIILLRSHTSVNVYWLIKIFGSFKGLFFCLCFCGYVCGILLFSKSIAETGNDQHSVMKVLPALHQYIISESSTADILLHPRIVYLYGNYGNYSNSTTSNFILLSPNTTTSMIMVDTVLPESNTESGCRALSEIEEWQTQSFPTCNTVHEMDVKSAVDSYDTSDVLLTFLGRGHFRDVWRWDRAGDISVALKTLRLRWDFLPRLLDNHRRDALVMERLTHSPFVMNIYGHCAHAALNELAVTSEQNATTRNLINFVQHSKDSQAEQGLPNISDHSAITLTQLTLATRLAVGVAHVHAVDDHPSIVNHDLKPDNILIVDGGHPKLSDFNAARFLQYNRNTNQTCGFRTVKKGEPWWVEQHEPWWRAPEELVDTDNIDEKIDVYSLGNLIFYILTSKFPRGFENSKRRKKIRNRVASGIPPRLATQFVQSKDPATKALVEALSACFEANPKKRASSREVANALLNVLIQVHPEGQKLFSKFFV
mmetsp:Transcript_9812/g.16305  ORF Transcript_9812/g.16305 Transcript_9812/m.16305 type:complete len:486 (-) Transcript_9812:232-1689(-)